VELKLESGRTHQIRVHMSSIGCPLIGDGMYRHPLYSRQQEGVQLPPEEAAQLAGIAELDAAIPRQALHAVRLSFRHPVTRTELVFEAPLPPDMALLQEKLRQAASGQ
jgi:23S rRNA pseudouridine1911/1915/1917 synthase